MLKNDLKAARASMQTFLDAVDGDSGDAELDAAMDMMHHLDNLTQTPVVRAAPDMLEALIGLMRWWTNTRSPNPNQDDEMPSDIFDAAQAAITKATTYQTQGETDA